MSESLFRRLLIMVALIFCGAFAGLPNVSAVD